MELALLRVCQVLLSHEGHELHCRAVQATCWGESAKEEAWRA